MKKQIKITMLGLLTLAFTVPVNATLHPPINGMIYDDALQLYWLEDANLAATNTFGVTGITGSLSIYGAGCMTWDKANEWITAMNNAKYLGFDDWRLPSAFNQDGSGPCVGFNCTDSEMGHLHHIDGISYTSSSFFDNISKWEYWTSTESLTNNSIAWSFGFKNDLQSENFKSLISFSVLPVRPANSPVPEPSTTLLFTIGVAGLASIARRRKN